MANALDGGMTNATAVDVAAGPSLHQPHTLIFFLVALVCLAVTVVPSFIVNRGRSCERRVFWGGVVGVTVSVFFAAVPYWNQAVGMALFSLAFMTANAYAYTPFIKIRGKVYAFYAQDSLPQPSPDGAPPLGSDDANYDPAPDSYGGLVTAKKHWWMAIFAVIFFGCCIVISADDKRWWLAPAAAAFLVVESLGFGYFDGSWRYSVARGQRLQFTILAVMTLGVFTVLYLTGYYTGKRWPWRHKQSMEYRAHPRHQKRYP